MLRNLSVSDHIISYIIHTRHVSHYSLEYFCLISLYLGLCHSHDRDEDVRVGVSEVGTNLDKFHDMESMSDKIQDLLLRRRMEDEVAATQAALEAVENDSLLSPAFSSRFQNLTFPSSKVSQTSANTFTIIDNCPQGGHSITSKPNSPECQEEEWLGPRGRLHLVCQMDKN